MLRCTMPAMISVRGSASFRAAAMFRPRSVVLLADPGQPETAIIARNLAGGGFKGVLAA